ncbi:MAG: hypothetical protein FWE41_07030 [Coriobacteriia bacterium]|nr:hypothetical protein [Coriobacteriia bacterium]MCL2750072.1 hypothetical protein [Coriobacteriia bacterium]
MIQEYVISAHPVASSTLVRYYVPRLSSATVRNELSWLENKGYIVAPHTSAGRMPTTTGYRTFVNSLLLHPQLIGATAQRCGRREDMSMGVGESMSKPKGTSTTPHTLISMQSLTSIAAASDKLALVPEILGLLAEQIEGLMVFWAPHLSNSVIHRGLPLLLTQPEFSETSAALPIMQLLESHGELMTIFEDIMQTDCLHIKIGSEHKDSQLYEFSLVAMRFDCSCLIASTAAGKVPAASTGKNYGVVALFGPTRMDYERAIIGVSTLVKNLERPATR